MNNFDFFQNMTMDSKINGDNNYVNQDMDVDVTMMNNSPMMGQPVNNGVQERVINRTFVHDVPHVCCNSDNIRAYGKNSLIISFIKKGKLKL